MNREPTKAKPPFRPFRDGLGFLATTFLALIEVLWPFGPKRAPGSKQVPLVAGEAEPVELDLSESSE